MEVVERKLLITHDLDGVHLQAPAPVFTTRDLVLQAVTLGLYKMKLPELGAPVIKWQQEGALSWKDAQHLKMHQGRLPIPGALDGARGFHLAAEYMSREIQSAILSGREPFLHELTAEELIAHGYFDFFPVDALFLNKGRKSALWKQHKIEKFVAGGFRVVHIDDDLKPLLASARINAQFPEDDPRVFGYAINNPSNDPRLRRAARLVLPHTVTPVDSVPDAAIDFLEKLKSKEI